MIKLDQIRSIELEISSFCSARCPLCPRNVFGYPYENGYKPRNLNLDEIKKILTVDFIKQLDEIKLEGNLGDFNMNHQAIDIIRYLRRSNESMMIKVATNGAARNEDFWKDLADLDVRVIFAIDGLEDTHSIYRKDTSWDTVIRNAKTYIRAGGSAAWRMIRFDHNKHQIDHCRELSIELGFEQFMLADDGRNSGPVFDRSGNLEYVLGDWKGMTDLVSILDVIKDGDVLAEDINVPNARNISCRALEANQIYISAEGNVYPCCYMGFNPKTFGRGTWHQPVNKQINQIMYENNALLHPLEHCIEWFNSIPACWSAAADGRMIVCDYHCSSDSTG